jgi:hypothetical protein
VILWVWGGSPLRFMPDSGTGLVGTPELPGPDGAGYRPARRLMPSSIFRIMAKSPNSLRLTVTTVAGRGT